MKTLKDFLMENEKELVVTNKFKKGQEKYVVSTRYNTKKSSKRKDYETHNTFINEDERITSRSKVIAVNDNIILEDAMVFREIADLEKNMPKEIFACKKDYEYAYNVIETDYGFIISRHIYSEKHSLQESSSSVYYKEDFGDTKIFTPEYDKVRPRYKSAVRKENNKTYYKFVLNKNNSRLSIRCCFTDSVPEINYVSLRKDDTNYHFETDVFTHLFEKDDKGLIKVNVFNLNDIEFMESLEKEIMDTLNTLEQVRIQKKYEINDSLGNYTIIVNTDSDDIELITLDKNNGDRSIYSNFKNLKFKDIKDNLYL